MSDRLELKLEPKSIEQMIIASLNEIGKIYEITPIKGLKCKEGEKFTFADGTDRQGLINTAEALECFFIPYFNIKGIREMFWKEELINLDHIANAIKYLVDDYTNDPDNDGLLGLSGTPYLNIKFMWRQ